MIDHDDPGPTHDAQDAHDPHGHDGGPGHAPSLHEDLALSPPAPTLGHADDADTTQAWRTDPTVLADPDLQSWLGQETLHADHLSDEGALSAQLAGDADAHLGDDVQDLVDRTLQALGGADGGL